MAEIGWLNVNDQISFPLVEGDSRLLLPGSAQLPKEGLSDAGFMLGQDSDFVVGTDTVTLFSVRVTIADIRFDFRSSAAGMAGYRWRFVFDLNAPFGCTASTVAIPIGGGPAAPDRGWGFLVCGHLESIRNLGIGLYALRTPPRVEPALIQSLVNTFVRSLNIGNTARNCPDACCGSSSIPSVEAHLYQAGIVGDVRFKEGKNAQISVSESDNRIEIRASRGAGDGEPCDDLLVVGPGPAGLIKDDGSICGNCGEYVRSFNGVATPDGRLQLAGAAGTNIVSDPANHKLIVKVAANRLCPPLVP